MPRPSRSADSSPLPPDRGHVDTERRHHASATFDAVSTRDGIALVVDDHRRVTDAIGDAIEPLAGFVDALVPRMRRGGRLIYVGAGTSGRLGVLDAAECPPTFHTDPEQVVGLIAGGDAALRRSSEAREDDPAGAVERLRTLALTPLDTLLGLAAGGTTPYVLGALPLAKGLSRDSDGRAAMTGLLTCARPASPPIDCDHLIHLDTGPELLTGSTRLKAGSATKLALNIISTLTFTRLGKVYGNLMVDLRASNDKLTDRAIRILMELCPQLTRAEAAERLTDADGRLKVALVMQRRGLDRVAAEAALERHEGCLRPLFDDEQVPV